MSEFHWIMLWLIINGIFALVFVGAAILRRAYLDWPRWPPED